MIWINNQFSFSKGKNFLAKGKKMHLLSPKTPILHLNDKKGRVLWHPDKKEGGHRCYAYCTPLGCDCFISFCASTRLKPRKEVLK
jgi:hypothetical protein